MHFLLAMAVMLLAVGRADAQKANFYLDGASEEWPVGVAAAVPNDETAAALLGALADRGFWYASLDSVTQGLEGHHYYMTRGRPVTVRRLRLQGVTVLDTVSWRRMFASAVTERFDRGALQEAMASLLSQYATDGYPLASASAVAQIADTTESVVDITVSVDEGIVVELAEVELDERIRTRRGLLARLAGMDIGAPVREFDPEVVRSRLVATGLFAEVGEVRLESDAQGKGTLTVPLVEKPPGSFDLVLGYLSNASGRGSLVGNGHIVLSNLFGGARTISMKLDRLSGRVSTLDARIDDPFIFRTSFGAGVGFRGEQRDSTYGKQAYDALVEYRPNAVLAVSAGVSQELTRPGQSGLPLVGGRQRIPRASTLFAGLGVTYRGLDNVANPRRGIDVTTRFERGTKRTVARVVAGADTLSQSEGFSQQRLTSRGRAYVGFGSRQVVAVGLDARLLLSSRYDEADLLRIGGANSLRGYNEEQFSGRFVARALTEIRVVLDASSYVFVFGDIGYVEEATGSSGSFYPGFGLGIQFDTAVGLMNATYGMNLDDGPLNGKVHVGLSFAL